MRPSSRREWFPSSAWPSSSERSCHRAPERSKGRPREGRRYTGGVADRRILSIDVFRGLTVAGMVLVNNPGTWGAVYAPLRHADWHGWTPTDLIFPFFLFNKALWSSSYAVFTAGAALVVLAACYWLVEI